MKKLGLVGGVGPASTLDYYKGINEGFRTRVPGDSNPPMLIDSLDLSVAYRLVSEKQWDSFTDLFVNSLETLHGAGAQFAAIAANTAHIVFDRIAARSPVPLLSIVEETCKAAKAAGCKSVVIVGTRFTMQSGLYKDAFKKYGIDCFVPTPEEQDEIHAIIFPNLQEGIIDPVQKRDMLRICARNIAEHNADALILGCTEIPLLVKEGDLDTRLLDTTQIHIDAILDEILA